MNAIEVTVQRTRVEVATKGVQGPAGVGAAEAMFTGGNAGQIILKNSSADYDGGWTSLDDLATWFSNQLA